MAELRLMMVSGSLGMARHGSRSQSALDECLASEKVSPWCSLATADAVLFQREIGIPTSVDYAIEAALSVKEQLPGPAEARLVWAGVLSPEEMSPPTDGLGEMMATHGRWLNGPGTWTLNVGPVAAPGIGAGAWSVSFIQTFSGMIGSSRPPPCGPQSALQTYTLPSLSQPDPWGAEFRAISTSRGFLYRPKQSRRGLFTRHDDSTLGQPIFSVQSKSLAGPSFGGIRTNPTETLSGHGLRMHSPHAL